MTTSIDPVAVEKALRDSKDKEHFQRVLCVWLKLSLSLSSTKIALAIGWKPAHVRTVQARFKKQGVQSLVSKRKGGRKRENISFDREAQILDKFARRARRGHALDVGQIQKAYELSVGRQVPRSTIYRVIARHGLRRFLPRARTF
jgi:transposase